MLPMVVALLTVLNSSTRPALLGQAGELAPQTWLRYLPTASHSSHDGPKEMEIVLRVRCDDTKSSGGEDKWRPELWGIGAGCDYWREEIVVGYFADAGGWSAVLLHGGYVRELLPSRVSTIQLASQPPTWSFAEPSVLPSRPTDYSRPKTLTITTIEVKVDGVSRVGEQLQLPFGLNHHVSLVPRFPDMATTLTPP
jgi:hypothetical protein